MKKQIIRTVITSQLWCKNLLMYNIFRKCTITSWDIFLLFLFCFLLPIPITLLAFLGSSSSSIALGGFARILMFYLELALDIATYNWP